MAPPLNSTRPNTDQVLVEEKLSARILTLNRPRQLNALSFQMGKGRAFCAGGDIAAVFQDIKEVGFEFYRPNGVSSHHNQVAVEVFAVPETALGLFPPSHFLSRLPGFFGEYVGLTGTRLDGAEMLACGLATHFVPSEESEALNKKDDWISATIQSLKGASPTSLKISLRSIRQGRLQGVGQCLVREYRMACNAMQGKVSKDLFEGYRAILLAKNKNPKKWEPSKLELVSDAMVATYFSMMDNEDWEDLKLPARSNLPVYAIAKL
uniref:3-hydroxyisobutyryl-CoA hydrolase n=1 Tax=Fagus sylvatica TaxID=28930 RepID=A0A2N9EKQ1_FAGSY